MIDMLTQDCIYFSRHQTFFRGRNQNPDAVSLYVEKDKKTANSGTIIISCDVYNNLEGIRDMLMHSGFIRDNEDCKFYKVWKIPFRYTLDASSLLDKVITTLDVALENAPLLLYASTFQKAVSDYYHFMKSSHPRLNYLEIMHHLGYWDEYKFTEGLEEDEAGDVNFMVAPYKRGLWAAWASGDLIVPLFPSEIDARQFLHKRARCFLANTIEISTLPVNQNGYSPKLYVLMDQTKNVNERVRWLQAELVRLRKRSKRVSTQD
jgi:hypothetical protein